MTLRECDEARRVTALNLQYALGCAAAAAGLQSLLSELSNTVTLHEPQEAP
jgi:hypothetical protein